MLAVTLTTNPAVVAVWPVSEWDAELAVAEAVLRDRAAECLKGVEYFEGEKLMYQKRLKSNGGGTEEERKLLGFFARRIDDCVTDLKEARDQMEKVRQLREKERKLRAEPPKEEKK